MIFSTFIFSPIPSYDYLCVPHSTLIVFIFLEIINQSDKMGFKVLVLLVLLKLATPSIFLGVRAKQPRCMVEFMAGEGGVSSMKIKVEFPQIEKRQTGQHFQVSLRNTETNTVDQTVVESGGKYYKQSQLENNVIYELCIVLKTHRDIEVIVEYEAESRYEDAQSFKEAAYPEGLLKKEDFKEAFFAANHMTKTIKEYLLEHKSRDEQQYKEFTNTQRINSRLTWLSAIQLLVLLTAGAYQFFTLKNYLTNKQYI